MINGFECFCGEGRFSKDELIQHVKEEHPEVENLWVCQQCDKAFKKYQEAKDHVLWKHDVYCDECQDNYIYDAFMKVWYFTVEKDVPIEALSEQDAEYKFKEKYPGLPILGIIRPESIISIERRTEK